MEDLVKKIMEIEKNANKIVEDEKEKIAMLDNEVNRILTEKKLQMEEKREKKINDIIQNENKDEDEQLIALNKEFQEKKDEMESFFKNNKKRLTDDIVAKVLER